tara:strand:- start:86 stop:514 length:429 start_codon:yes stop_codon:yes gene_type:complete
MTKTLYVPKHVIKSKKEKPEKPETPALHKLPEPTGWRILILPYKGKAKTESGVYLPDQVVEREALATVCGYVLKLGPLAYQDPEKFGTTANGQTGVWCKKGDWVIFGRYAGSRFKIEGGEVRLLNDDEILATIKNPEDILHT